MAILNKDLSMYRTATTGGSMQQEDKNKKKKTPEEIRKEVEMKLALGRYIDKGGYKKSQQMKNRVKKNTRSKPFMPLSQNPIDNTEQQEITRQNKTQPNVLKVLDDNVKTKTNTTTQQKSKGGFGIFTGNATDLRNPEEFKVNKKYQNRVNKILGRNY